MERNSSRPLQAHIGIASGEVVAGSVGRADGHDYTVLGDSWNLAAQLVAAAAPGQTLLSEGVFPRSAASASASRSRTSTRRDRCTGPCLAAGRHFWQCHGGGQPKRIRRPRSGTRPIQGHPRGLARPARWPVVYVRGEAGIGKTRLVEEMRSFAETRGFRTHRSLVLDFGVGRGQDPIRSLLQSLLDLSPASPPERRRDAGERLVKQEIITGQQLVFLNDFLDLPQLGEWRALYDAMDNAARNRGKRAVASAVAAHACRSGPILIIVKDLHWADPQVLAHLAALASAMADGPGLLAMTSRVEGDPIDPAWRAACRGAPFATIDLGPLKTVRSAKPCRRFHRHQPALGARLYRTRRRQSAVS